jgi:hypothetical protein
LLSAFLVGDLNAYFTTLDTNNPNANPSFTGLNSLKNKHNLNDCYRSLHPGIKAFTWFRKTPSGGLQATRIDMSLSSLPPKKCKILPIGISTDHMALLTTLIIPLKPRLSDPFTRPQMEYKRKFDLESSEAYNALLHDTLHEDSPSNAISQILTNAAKYSNPAAQATHKNRTVFKERGIEIKELHKITTIIKKLINKQPLSKKQNTAVIPYSLEDPLPEFLEKQKELKKKVKNMNRQNLNRRITTCVKKLNEEAKKKSSLFYQKIRQAINPSSSNLPDQVYLLDDQKNIKKVVTNPAKIPEATADHWGKVFKRRNPDNLEGPCYPPEGPKLPPTYPRLTRPAELQELDAILNNLGNDTAPGPDLAAPELFKKLDQENRNTLLTHINMILEKKQLPPNWKETLIWPIYKKDDPYNPGNYRPISLCQTIYKILTHIVHKRLSKLFEGHEILSETQAGFRPKRNTHEQILLLNLIKEEAAYRKIFLHIFQIDFEQAFDSVPHETITKTLAYYNVDPEDIELIKALYEDTKTKVITKYDLTPPIDVENGVKQGDPLHHSYQSITEISPEVGTRLPNFKWRHCLEHNLCRRLKPPQ